MQQRQPGTPPPPNTKQLDNLPARVLQFLLCLHCQSCAHCQPLLLLSRSTKVEEHYHTQYRTSALKHIFLTSIQLTRVPILHAIHKTRCPHFPQSNRLAEQRVKTVQSLIKKAADPHLTLPWCNIFPAELKIRTDIRTNNFLTHILPRWEFIETLREKDKE